MRKLFSALLLVLTMFLTSQAQNLSNYPSIKYTGDITVGYGIGVGDLSLNRVSIGTIQGIKVGEYFSAGLGIQLDYFHDLDKYFGEDYSKGELALPVYVDLRGYLPVADNVSLQAFCDLGAAFGVTSGFSGYNGFYCTPGVAIQYGHLKFQIGYNFLKISDLLDLSTNALQLKLGYAF